jgi:CO dehydrogenase/acetyl-CoA synthase gamma subunit (corrinoid Fe-S protein)
VDGFAIEATSNGAAFVSAVEAVLAMAPRPLILIADDPQVRRGVQRVFQHGLV